jgi:signal transduction histidine kinase
VNHDAREEPAATSHPGTNLTGRPEDCLAGGGELGALMRAMDWSKTPLGPVSAWPQSLRTSVSIMLASGFAVVVAWGPEHIFLYNDRYRPILGATKHPMALGNRSADIFPEVWDFIGPLFRKTLAGETVALDDVLIPLDRNGYLEECYFTLSYSPIRDESGGVGGMLAIVAETTERVQGERRLRTLRDLASVAPRAHTAQEACENGARTLSANPTDVPFALFYLVDADGSKTRLVGRTGLDGEVGTDPETWPLAEAARSGRPVVVDDLRERLGARPGGAYPEVAHTALVLPLTRPGLAHPHGFLVAGVSPRRALDDRYQGFFDLAAEHVASAITNALSHEAERKRAEALAEIDHAKTTFFSNVSHEFRTPLTLMLAPIEEMRAERDGGDSAAARDRLDLLHRNAHRLLKLVNTLLEFSRTEAGRAQASYEPTDLAALTADLASSFRSAVERAGLTLVVDCPRLSEPIFVDHDMWEQIVLNLLSNAFKFTFEGSITVRLRAVDGRAELEVTDTGVGIEERELPRLFERFHRVERVRSRSHEGSGIGLALVQELVRMHGGEIHVKSAVGMGTTFCVRVPCGTAHLAKERIRAERAATSTASGAAPYVQEAIGWLASADSGPPVPVSETTDHRERIVVADDNRDVRDYIARLLRENWNVEAVGDGQMALEAIRRKPPALVVADVMMPGMDGFALLRAIRGDQAIRDTPVVLLSARAGEEATAEGLKAGADDYLVKPFSARELLVRVTTRLAAAKQRASLYNAFMQAPFPVAIFRGPTHVIEAANEAILKAWGMDASVVGRPLAEALPEIRQRSFPGLLDGVYRTGVAHEGRGELARLPTGPGGALQDAYYNYMYAPLRSSRGHVEGIMVSAFDVTPLRRAAKESERALAREQLARASSESASRAKDEFLATMSHELRTPLNAILGWSSILSRRPRDEATLKRGLEVIERNARAQDRIVNDLLDVSRIISGKLHLSLRRVEVSAMVHAAADVVRTAADGKGVQLVVDIDPDIGATVADPDRLQQILWNLLSNAVRYTPRGGSVKVMGARTNSGIQLCVKDTGSGIPREHLPHIFERFRQVDSSTTRRHGGLGLGLAIVRHLIEAHGGSVEARSEGENQGATFTIALPIRALIPAEPRGNPGSAAAALESETQVCRSDDTLLSNVRVLVVDDDADSIELLSVALGEAGAEVTAVRSAREALGARGPFDIIISDIGMPEIDGYSFIRRVRSSDLGAVPAIALTAYARSEDAERATRAGFQEHLTKPLDARKLLETVRLWARTPEVRRDAIG